MDTELVCEVIEYLNSLPDGTEITTAEAAEAVTGETPDDKVLLALDEELRRKASRNKLVLEPVRNKPLYDKQLFREPYILQHKTPGGRLQADKWDCIVSVASGILTAEMDIFWAKDLSLEAAHSWGADKTNEFVINAARKHESSENKEHKVRELDLAKAIAILEDDFPIAADGLKDDFGGGRQHHLWDFSHHPTLTGLLFSIVSQFSGRVYGTDVDGNFKSVPIPGWKKPDLVTGLYEGSVTWAMHMISDMAGSYSSVRQGKEGTGLPGPLLSFFKELSSMPGIRALAGKDENGHYRFSVICSKLFHGTLLSEHDENGKLIKPGPIFDLRTELGLGHESVSSKQYIPVVINETIVCAFYSVSRLVRQLEIQPVSDVQELKTLDFRAFLPWKSPALLHMRTLASATFSVVEITTAGIQAYVRNKGNKAAAAADFIQRINYVGVMRLTLAVSSETCSALSHLYDRFEMLIAQQKARLAAVCPEAFEGIGIAKKLAVTAEAISKIGTPVGFISAAIGVYDELSRAAKELEIAREDRIRIEAECRIQIQTIRENRQYMEEAVEQYMLERLQSLSEGLSDMEQAWSGGDTDLFLSGSASIQKTLGNNNGFASQAEFDDLMRSEPVIKL